MSLKDNWNNPEKLARLDMADAERKGRKAMESEKKSDDSGKTQQLPKRYRLYDKINVSLKTMDIIVYSIAALIVVCLIIGVATGGQ
ncbi:MAG: hypothetical protein E7337_00575 [Clostridiales bacterium]|nr:hypothetical protein [Clostridiales bacterium]